MIIDSQHINLNEVINTDALSGLKNLPDECVDCCVTSPPYWGLRDYGLKPISWPRVNYTIFGFNIDVLKWSGQLGLEPTPEMFVGHIVLIFREVKRVLKKEGTLWLNFGDSYSSAGKDRTIEQTEAKSTLQGRKNGNILKQINKVSSFLKPKDLVGIPWMVAYALRDDGWYLRQDIIWAKKNYMPESVNDRCTKSHEYIFLLTKSKKYFFDYQAILEQADYDNRKDTQFKGSKKYKDSGQTFAEQGHERWPNKIKPGKEGAGFKGHSGNYGPDGELLTHIKNGIPARNKRSVWHVNTKPFPDAHFATFPPKLIVDCIKAGTSEKGYCSECGKPYVRIVEKELVPTKKASFNSKVDKRDLLADKNDQGSNRMKDGHKSGWINKIETKGWEPSCNCNAEIVPGIVLDPFMGAWTTKIVARKLNRNCIGFELNQDYMKIGAKREYEELGMFK